MFNILKLKIIYTLIKLVYSLINRIGRQRKKMGDNTMAGIKETKELMLFGVSLAAAIDSATQDGFQWTDLLDLVPPMTKMPGAISGIDDVPLEIADLDEIERAELVKAIQDLDFVSDKSEDIAEQALRTGVEICNLIMKIREAKKSA